MKTAFAKKEIESALARRFGGIFERHEKPPIESLSMGMDEMDLLFHGVPRGGITEIHGASSSGRTSLFLSTLAVATLKEETCALVDCNDTFDLLSANNARVNFHRLLWVRCEHNLERAFKAVDLLLHSGGFGLVILNLSDVAAKSARRIVSSWWFRFRRALENTPTALLVITPITCVRSCAVLILELQRESVAWPVSSSLIPEEKPIGSLKKDPWSQKLSLVQSSKQLPAMSSGLLSHTHLIQGTQVRVNQERPVEWSQGKFTTCR
jgi:recA bacterial DNA recombination protein